MSNQAPPITNKKNKWLFDQVDCEFPTKESIDGLQLYRASAEQRTTEPFSIAVTECEEMEHYLVDFHRLTIMFALLQSKRWSDESEQSLIVEFLTQIILSPEHDLYLSFSHGEPVGAAMVTRLESELLVSDVVYKQAFDKERVAGYLSCLLEKVTQEMSAVEKILIEI
ncbi:hypothetical protein D8T39_07015 [Vibrio vulnificus]|uniref:hypothetical protein n=1 Tax=Vibrio vulnificus TaxID=672 RepID=UPI001029A355|nr:hypothetical protein [Vibrio vulnificus]EGQ7995261.1 hypothetical protein [Vibrio vulnificus]MCU8152945.1 hypothetical protein [Vibrio vulnificus]RZP94774.1 hypothetical protein D8T56_05050 [Vibrio vulnificus]RZQ12167.1 hypothetical protein D8T39_07015 [Vibrio vulnificus]